MTSPEPTRLVCQPWAGIGDLPEKRPDLDNDAWDRLLWQASETLYALSGRQFSGPCESMVTVRRPARDRGRPYGWVAGALYPDAAGWGAAWATRDEALVAALPGRPVTAIVEATLAGEPLEVVLDSPGAGLIYRADGRAWPADDSCEITYTHGLPPPIGGRNCAVLMAIEFGKVWTNGKCALPRRIEQVTREGVQYGIGNSAEYLRKGQIGVPEIDQWLAEVNRYGFTAPPSVWSPDSAKIRRRVRD